MNRILIDRCIFHRFEAIKESSFLRHATDDSIQVYYSPRFIEETLRYGNMGEFSRQWDYLAQLNSRNWFNTPRKILQAEFRQETNTDYFLMTKEEIQTILDNCQKYIGGQLCDRLVEQAIAETQRERQRMEELVGTLRTMKASKHFEYDEFDIFVQQNAETHLREVLLPMTGENVEIIDRWRRNPERFDFTNFFIRCLLATMFLPVVDHQHQPHYNDLADAEQLAFLLWTDVMVTDDSGFMKKGFDLLNKSGIKTIQSSDELLAGYPAAHLTSSSP